MAEKRFACKGFALPFSFKNSLTKNSSIITKIKLAQCSKEFCQLTKKGFKLEFSYLHIKWSRYFEGYKCYDYGISAMLNPYHKLLENDFVVKEWFVVDCGLKSWYKTLIPKMNISTVFRLSLTGSVIYVDDLEKLLVPNIKTIDVVNIKTVPNINVAVFVMEKLPLNIELAASWQPGISSLASLIAVKRKQKISIFRLNLINENIPLADIKMFEKEHIMSPNGRLYLESKTETLYHNYLQ